jgi:hypothetical protein
MPGKEEELYPFLGLPDLDPAEEQRLVKNCLMVTDIGVVEDPERTDQPNRSPHLLSAEKR